MENNIAGKSVAVVNCRLCPGDVPVAQWVVPVGADREQRKPDQSDCFIVTSKVPARADDPSHSGIRIIHLIGGVATTTARTGGNAMI